MTIGFSSSLSPSSSNGHQNDRSLFPLSLLSKPRKEIERRHRSRIKCQQRSMIVCLTFGIFCVSCCSILLSSQVCLQSSDASFHEQQQQSISRSLRTSSTTQLQPQPQQQQQQQNNDKNGQQRVVMAVLNGGIREEDYFSSLYEDLVDIKSKYGYDLMIFSDENNYNPNRIGEIRLPPFPVDKIFRKMSFGKDQMDFPNAEAFWITENDAIICNKTKLAATFDWFLSDKDSSSSSKKSLSYWDSCQQSTKRDDTLATALGFTLYEKNPCGMVATLLTKESLLKIQRNLKNSLFHWAIEGIFHSTRTMDASVENGQVLVHGGSISTSGGEWGQYTCDDPNGLKFKEQSKREAEAAIAAGEKPKEYIG